MARDEDDRARPPSMHEIGQDLSLLSVEELTARIELLGGEIERLGQTAAKKKASRDAAASFFKP